MATAIARDPALRVTSSSTLGFSISLAQLRGVQTVRTAAPAEQKDVV